MLNPNCLDVSNQPKLAGFTLTAILSWISYVKGELGSGEGN